MIEITIDFQGGRFILVHQQEQSAGLSALAFLSILLKTYWQKSSNKCANPCRNSRSSASYYYNISSFGIQNRGRDCSDSLFWDKKNRV